MMSILNNPRERTRFMRFATVGVMGAIVDFGIFNLLSTILGVAVVLASVCSFSAAVSSNFIWNRYWTYPDSRSKKVSRQIVEFASISVVGLAIRTPLIVFLEKPLPALFAKMPIPLNPQFVGHNAALATAVIVVMFWNFFVNRYWTYGDVE
jgi:putative flippase GtrA